MSGATVLWLGWVLIVLGILFLLVGLVGAARKYVLTPVHLQGLAATGIPWIAIIKALLKEGGWGVAAALGLGLLLLGLILVGIKLPAVT